MELGVTGYEKADTTAGAELGCCHTSSLSSSTLAYFLKLTFIAR